MNDISPVSLEQIRKTYDEILPRPQDKVVMCEQLLRSISYCENAGSAAWSVSMLDRGFRLNVGQVEVLTCFYTFWDREEYEISHDVGFLDVRFLISGPAAQQLVQRIDPDLVAQMSYRSVNEPHWAVTAALLVEGELSDGEREQTIEMIEALQSSHQHFVIRAAHTPSGSLRKRSNFARFNCEAMLAYAREETDAIAPLPPSSIPAAPN